MKNKKLFRIIPAFLLTGLLLFTACPNNIGSGNPDSGYITGTITLIDVPDPAPQVSISVSGSVNNRLWQSDIYPINLDSNDYNDISWSIPMSKESYFFPSNGRFRLYVQQAGGTDGFEIYIQEPTPYINGKNADVGSLGTVSFKTITLSGTINVTYEKKTVPHVEIGASTSEHERIGYTSLVSPDEDAQWSINLPVFSSPTKIFFRVIGYDENNVRLFNKTVDPSKYASDSDIPDIPLDLKDITDNPENIIQLIENKWACGEITVNYDIEWYSFNVTNGKKYYLWWNDSNSGDNTKTLDIDVYAKDENKDSIQLKNENNGANENDSAWESPVSFTADWTGIVYIRVRAFDWAAGLGTYAIVYSSNNEKPDDGEITGTEANPISLTLGVWANGSIPSSTSGRAIWYSFDVTGEETYYIWWNDKGEGDRTKTLDVKVDIYYGGGMPIYLEVDSSWNKVTDDDHPDNDRPISFKADSKETTVKLKVSPFFMYEDETNTNKDKGNFAIVYSSKTANPSVTRPN